MGRARALPCQAARWAPRDRAVVCAFALWLSFGAGVLPRRATAGEGIPALSARILDWREKVRSEERALARFLARSDAGLARLRDRMERAGPEREAAFLAHYVHLYAARLEEERRGLRAIQASVRRMRAYAWDLIRALDAGRRGSQPTVGRRGFLSDQYQGVAAATAALARRLEREDEASDTGEVLYSGWLALEAGEGPEPEPRRDETMDLLRRLDEVDARIQARLDELRPERREVQRLVAGSGDRRRVRDVAAARRGAPVAHRRPERTVRLGSGTTCRHASGPVWECRSRRAWVERARARSTPR